MWFLKFYVCLIINSLYIMLNRLGWTVFYILGVYSLHTNTHTHIYIIITLYFIHVVIIIMWCSIYMHIVKWYSVHIFIYIILISDPLIFIYPIICLKYVCLATFAECNSQFLIVRLGRCLKLIASTRGTFCHEFASQFGLELFLFGKNRKPRSTGLELFLFGKNRKPRSTGPPQSIAALWQIDN